MKHFRKGLSAVSLAVCAGALMAQQPPTAGDQPELIRHGLNPHGVGAAPPAGSTAQMTPMITYHGGPVMVTPVPYLIWYGNWNQSNGSDTPGGQAILRDLMSGLSGSDYFKINQSYITPSGFLG